jgi:cell division septation protein DedD
MDLNKIFSKIIGEQEVPKGKKSNTLVNAITNRNPITFYYTGPKEPPKDSVKSGVRVRAEAVAMGLSKGGNVIIRAYVQPPSVSKKGYNKTNWRTFRVDRMSNLQILQDETFDVTRPGYKEGSESNKGPMATTYVTSNWDKTPDVNKQETPPPTPTATPQPKPTVKPSKEPLPQPKTDEKPLPTPEETPKDFSGEIFNKLQNNIRDINGEKIINTQDFENASVELYKMKEKEWVDSQRQVGKNTSPGEGTRKRFEMSSKSELSNLLSKNNIKVSDVVDGEDLNTTNLQESIIRIKTLMLMIN